ncbi:GNAT family N-acetyltransferase [Streptosporangium pseudovulgare]|uniref:N-acetyltransferase n=1 Tax=Streptosporangium pseudovulgare TaxID=35765 RepID=A0ABQ2QQ69_9ACTN|nr:GNAT family N-acetyltransferase [Streptosporangium pseudovulgare]GGP90826.1 N-acetyltransferase [Streptosporangium pseudovulgare]
MHELSRLLEAAGRGDFPAADGSVRFTGQPSPRDCGVIAFTAHSVVFADVDHEWLRGLLPADDLSAPLHPRFLRALEERTGRRVDNVDMLLTAGPLTGPPPMPLTELTDRGHPRVRRALRHRDDVRVWEADGGVVLLGRGVAGRWEIAGEVDPGHRDAGLGRLLALAGRHLLTTVDGAAHTLWAQVAPGNAASVRASLAAGFRPVGAEALLIEPERP